MKYNKSKGWKEIIARQAYTRKEEIATISVFPLRNQRKKKKLNQNQAKGRNNMVRAESDDMKEEKQQRKSEQKVLPGIKNAIS